MADTWEALREECLACRKCGLCEKRKNVVFGVGSENAEVMFIGEAPGANEDEQGVPFVGRAGKLLDDMLSLIGLTRDSIFIANIIKCRPDNNRDPLAGEQDACIDYLRRQVALIRPKIIVCLGRIAAMRIIEPEYKISLQHGHWQERNGVWMTAFYHPAALLRDPRRRPEAFEDMQALRRKINEVCAYTYVKP